MADAQKPNLFCNSGYILDNDRSFKDLDNITLRHAVVVVAFVLLLLASFLAYPRVEAALITRAQDASKSTLRLVSGAVDQAIGQFKPIPGLIASDPIFQSLLAETDNEGLVPFVNEKLRHIADAVGASETYVMDPEGTTVAAAIIAMRGLLLVRISNIARISKGLSQARALSFRSWDDLR